MKTKSAALRPADEAQAVEAIRAARGRREPLEIAGGGTKRGLGRPVQAAATLSAAAMSGIVLYEPSELVIRARAGTPVAEMEAALAAGGQRLAFEPVTLAGLYGNGAGATVGGIVACNLSGPRRVQAGAARDALIGVRAVTGRGEAIKAGGRVMKNVAGYDLVRLLAGSHGTLALLTEVTFKVLPAPETEATLEFAGLDAAAACACMARALASPWEVTGAAHLPGGAGAARTLLRIEGFARQVEYRTGALADALDRCGQPLVLKAGESREAWRAVGGVEPLAAGHGEAVWKVCVAPARAGEAALGLEDRAGARVLLDWGGGLIWAAVQAGDDAAAPAVRAIVARTGGHATLMRAPDETRVRADVFQQLPEPVMDMSRRIKDSFDPDRILNPGRMYAGL